MVMYSWKRFFYTAWLFMSIFLLPWWVVGIFALLGVFLFRRYYEIIVVGLVMDILFGFPDNRWYVTGIHTLIFCGMIAISRMGEKIFTRPNVMNKL